MVITSSSGILWLYIIKRLYIIKEGICCYYLEINNGKVLQKYLNNFFSFKTSTSLFYVLHQEALIPYLDETRYLIFLRQFFKKKAFSFESQEWVQKHICEKLILSNLFKTLEKRLVLVTSANLFKTLTKGMGLVTSSYIVQNICINLFSILNF